MKRSFIWLLGMLTLCGCASTQEAADILNRHFAGKNIDAFVLRYGAPYQKHQLNSGDLMYMWSSRIQSYSVPTTTTVQGSASPYGFSGTGVTAGGGIVSVFCEVQIVTSSDGTIKSISPFRDTIGNWTTSRCAEVFKE